MKHRPHIYLLFLALVGFILAGTLHAPLLEKRRSYHLDLADPLKNSPPLVAFTTVALGGFRGIIADMLWLRATQLQEEGRYFEIVQLSDWITKLEPRFTPVWAFHAWNMAYNISVLLNSPEDRWRWVNHGIQLLRDEGLLYNPGSAKLYWELGWLFQHKLGADLDAAHSYYKRKWAEEMTRALGGARPDYAALLNAPHTREALLADAATEKLVRRLQEKGIEALDASLLETSVLPDDVQGMLKSAEGERLLDHLKVRNLMDNYGLVPAQLQQVDHLYGPLDWRLPEAHSLYWAWRALPLASGYDKVALDRMIYQSLCELFREGNLTFDAEKGVYETGPHWAGFEPALSSIESAIAAHTGFRGMQVIRANLLQEAIRLREAAGETEEAEALRERLQAAFPDGLPGGATHEH